MKKLHIALLVISTLALPLAVIWAIRVMGWPLNYSFEDYGAVFVLLITLHFFTARKA